MCAKLFEPAIKIYNSLTGSWNLELQGKRTGQLRRVRGRDVDLITISNYVVIFKEKILITTEVKKPMLSAMVDNIINKFLPNLDFEKKVNEVIHQRLTLGTFCILTDGSIIFCIEFIYMKKMKNIILSKLL